MNSICARIAFACVALMTLLMSWALSGQRDSDTDCCTGTADPAQPCACAFTSFAVSYFRGFAALLLTALAVSIAISNRLPKRAGGKWLMALSGGICLMTIAFFLFSVVNSHALCRTMPTAVTMAENVGGATNSEGHALSACGHLIAFVSLQVIAMCAAAQNAVSDTISVVTEDTEMC
jgi:hypothetical protein